MVLDELPGNDSPGAVADQHDLTIAFLAEFRTCFSNSGQSAISSAVTV